MLLLRSSLVAICQLRQQRWYNQIHDPSIMVLTDFVPSLLEMQIIGAPSHPFVVFQISRFATGAHFFKDSVSLRAFTLIHFIMVHDPSTTPPRPSTDADLPASSLTPPSALCHSSLYIPPPHVPPYPLLHLRAATVASYIRCSTHFSLQASSGLSARPYACIPRVLTGLFINTRPNYHTYNKALATCFNGTVESIYVGTTITTYILEDANTEITCDLKCL